MKLFFGEKESFGIELIIESMDKNGSYLGYSRLWLGENFIGTIEDLIYLKGYLLDKLVRIKTVREFDDSNFKDKESKFSFFEEKNNDYDDFEIDSYRVNFGTMSDDFQIWVYKKGKSLIFLWKFEGSISSNKFTDLRNYKDGIYEYEMCYANFIMYVNVLNKFLGINNLIEIP